MTMAPRSGEGAIEINNNNNDLLNSRGGFDGVLEG
jgi:hypothetical protein